MSASKLDAVYRSILLTKFFTKGWGKPENLRRLFEFRKVVSNRDECFKLIEPDYPVTITKDETQSECRLVEGYFLSPLERFLPGIVPEAAQRAHFQVMLPNHWQTPGCKPVCLHLAGTGDHYFWRRRNLMVKPLLKEAGIGGIILENPFYGLRKPVDQVRSSLHNVSDIFVMGGCLILESLVLFHWCERQGLGPLGVTGLSMGGHMASLAATNWPKPLVLVPCLSWATASAVFLQGVMAQSINWDLLEDQYLSDGAYREKLSKMVTVIDEAFLEGKRFAQTYSDNAPSAPSTPSEHHAPMFAINRKDQKMDITYKESSSGELTEGSVVDMSHNTLETTADRPGPLHTAGTVDTTAGTPADTVDTIRDELEMLLKEGKISSTLHDKLVGGEKFELQPEEIDDLNSLTNDRVKEILLRFKVLSRAGKFAEHQEKVDQVEDILHTTDAHPDFETGHTCSRKRPDSETMANKQSESQKLFNGSTEIVQKKMKMREKKSWHISDLITSDYWMNLPFVRLRGSGAGSGAARKIDIRQIHWRDREALQFMRGIMDECTHLSNFSVPYDTSLIIAVCAKHDAYVPRDDVGTLEEIWPGAEVRYVDAGHVSAYILHQSLFRSCIIEAFERSKKKWKDGKHIN